MRKVQKLFLLLLFLLPLFFSCKKDPQGPTDIRIRNLTDSVFRNVYVNTSGGEYNYGEVKPHTETPYHRFEIAYRQALITLEINGEQYELKPVDYTYEVPLGRGKYTYELAIADTASHKLSIHVIADAPL